MSNTATHPIDALRGGRRPEIARRRPRPASARPTSVPPAPPPPGVRRLVMFLGLDTVPRRRSSSAKRADDGAQGPAQPGWPR